MGYLHINTILQNDEMKERVGIKEKMNKKIISSSMSNCEDNFSHKNAGMRSSTEGGMIYADVVKSQPYKVHSEGSQDIRDNNDI